MVCHVVGEVIDGLSSSWLGHGWFVKSLLRSLMVCQVVG